MRPEESSQSVLGVKVGLYGLGPNDPIEINNVKEGSLILVIYGLSGLYFLGAASESGLISIMENLVTQLSTYQVNISYSYNDKKLNITDSSGFFQFNVIVLGKDQ